MSKKSLSINAISNWLSLCVNVIISLILTPFLINLLDDRLYGVWMILVSFIGVYGILDLGISSAIGRFVAYYLGKKDELSAREIFSSALFIFIFIGIILILLSYFFASNISDFFKIEYTQKTDFEFSFIIISFCVTLTLINNAFSATFCAHEEFLLLNSIKVISEIIRFILIIKFVSLSSPLASLASITLFSIIFQTIFLFIFNITFIQTKLFSFFAINKNAIRDIALFAMPAAITVFSEMLRTRLDTLVIAKFLIVSEVTMYTIGSRFIVFISQFIVSLSGVLDPRFAYFAGKKATDDLNILFQKSFELLCYTSLGIGFLIIWMGPGLISAWVGAGYEDSYSVLVILAIGQSLAAIQMPSISLLFAINRHHILSILVLIEGTLNLLISIYLVKKFGINGVAFGTLIPIILIKVFCLPYFLKIIVGLKLRDILLPQLKGISAYSLLFFLFRNFQPLVLTWPGVFLWGFCSTAVLAIFTILFLFSKESKLAIFSIARAFLTSKK